MTPFSGTPSPKAMPPSANDILRQLGQPLSTSSFTPEDKAEPKACSSPKPSTPSPVQKRGSSGGKAANRGKAHFKKLIICCLEKYSAEQEIHHANVSALVQAAFPAIEKTVEAFHEFLHSAANKGPNRVTYGQTVRASGVLSKLYKWAKEDPEFGKRLSKLLQPEPTLDSGTEP